MPFNLLKTLIVLQNLVKSFNYAVRGGLLGVLHKRPENLGKISKSLIGVITARSQHQASGLLLAKRYHIECKQPDL